MTVSYQGDILSLAFQVEWVHKQPESGWDRGARRMAAEMTKKEIGSDIGAFQSVVGSFRYFVTSLSKLEPHPHTTAGAL